MRRRKCTPPVTKNAWAASCLSSRRSSFRGVSADLKECAFLANALLHFECPRIPLRDIDQPFFFTGTESRFRELKSVLSLSLTPSPHQEGAKQLNSFLHQARKLHSYTSSFAFSLSQASLNVLFSFCVGVHSVSSFTLGSRPWTESPS